MGEEMRNAEFGMRNRDRRERIRLKARKVAAEQDWRKEAIAKMRNEARGAKMIVDEITVCGRGSKTKVNNGAAYPPGSWIHLSSHLFLPILCPAPVSSVSPWLAPPATFGCCKLGKDAILCGEFQNHYGILCRHAISGSY